MATLREVARMDEKTRRYLKKKLNQRRKELRTVKRAVRKLAEELEYEYKIKWESCPLQELANRQSYKDIYDGSDWSVDKVIYFVVYRDGSIKEVPVGDYSRDSAYEGDYPVSWKKDIYVGDFLNENTIAVVKYSKCIITWRNYEREELTVYIPEVNKEELKEILLSAIKKIDKTEKLLELIARL